MNMMPISASGGPCSQCGGAQKLNVRRDVQHRVTASRVTPRKIHASQPNRISLFVGDVAASSRPVVLHTLLGSCVAVCLFDPVLRAGGMNHILLPSCRPGEQGTRCGVHAMELLINELMKIGGEKRRFIAKAFGAANVLKGEHMPAIGVQNANFVREFLATEKIPLLAERMGGTHAVHLFFHTDTGRATVHTVDGSRMQRILHAESTYKSSAKNLPIEGDITLF